MLARETEVLYAPCIALRLSLVGARAGQGSVHARASLSPGGSRRPGDPSHQAVLLATGTDDLRLSKRDAPDSYCPTIQARFTIRPGRSRIPSA